MAEKVEGAIIPEIEGNIREDDPHKLMTVANLYTVLRTLIDAGHGDADVKLMSSPTFEDLSIDLAMMSPKMGALFLMGGLDGDDVKMLEEQGLEDWEPQQTTIDPRIMDAIEAEYTVLPGTTPAVIEEAVAEYDPDVAESA